MIDGLILSRANTPNKEYMSLIKLRSAFDRVVEACFWHPAPGEEPPLYTQPTDNELLEFLQEGDEK